MEAVCHVGSVWMFAHCYLVSTGCPYVISNLKKAKDLVLGQYLCFVSFFLFSLCEIYHHCLEVVGSSDDLKRLGNVI